MGITKKPKNYHQVPKSSLFHYKIFMTGTSRMSHFQKVLFVNKYRNKYISMLYKYIIKDIKVNQDEIMLQFVFYQKKLYIILFN